MTAHESAAKSDAPLSAYKAKLVAGKCTERGCNRDPIDGSSMCRRCGRDALRRSKESKQRRRDARRAAGLCIWCPGDDPNPATPGEPGVLARPTSCLPCRIKRNRMRAADGGGNGVGSAARSAAIAAATSRDMTGPNGRVRYRGQQKRGQQPKWQLNLQDVRHAREDFDEFERAIGVLASPDAQKWHASERAQTEQATAHVGARMTRRTGDILERLGHFPQRHGPRPGEAVQQSDPEDDGTLSYKRVTDAARVAAAARAGLYVYAPPLDVTSGRRETAKEPKPPDLEPLRRGLAERGLGLVAEGAFYWMIVTRDGDAK